MRRRRLLGAVAVLLGALLGALLVAAPAGAQTTQEASAIDDTGWWTRAKQGPLPGDSLVYPDVEDGQLVVEGAPDGPTAVAAIRATLPEGTRAPMLTLEAASATGGDTAVVLACEVDGDWTGDHGGAWDDRPTPECSQSAEGEPEEDGDGWVFDLGLFRVEEDQLDVVLVAGVDPNSSGSAGSTFRLVFEEPTTSSIEVSESSTDTDFEVPEAGSFSGGDGDGDSSGPATASPPTASPPTASPGPTTSDSSFTSPSSSEGQTAPATPSNDDQQGQTAAGPVASSSSEALPSAPAPAPEPASTESNDGRLLGLLVVLCGGALLYWSSTLELPERRVLSRFVAASGAPGATTGAGSDTVDLTSPSEEQMGGLGRFRRVRTTPARRLGG